MLFLILTKGVVFAGRQMPLPKVFCRYEANGKSFGAERKINLRRLKNRLAEKKMLKRGA